MTKSQAKKRALKASGGKKPRPVKPETMLELLHTKQLLEAVLAQNPAIVRMINECPEALRLKETLKKRLLEWRPAIDTEGQAQDILALGRMCLQETNT